MKDIYIPKKVPRIEVRERLHGHTKIELRNVRTGRVERIEHDNTFTDGITDYMRTLGVFQNTFFRSDNQRNSPAWQNLVGGIFLFDSVLPTSPAAKYAPAGIKMTANGSYGVSNASDPQELGSYNSIESQVSDGSLSLVYDWGTSQGNGDIASVALTTKDGGYIGYGNDSNTGASPIAFDRNQSYGTNVYFSASASNQLGYAEIVGDYVYRTARGTDKPPVIASGATSYTLYKSHKAFSEIDLWDVNSASDNYAETVTFTFSALTEQYRLYWTGMGKYLLIPHNQKTSGSTYRFLVYDIATDTVGDYSFTNSTGETSDYGWYNVLTLIDDTYCLFVTQQGSNAWHWWKVNYKTGQIIGQVSGMPSNYMYAQARSSGFNASFAGRLIINTVASGSSVQRSYIYDAERNIVLPLNGGTQYPYGYGYDQNLDCMVRYNSTSSQIYFFEGAIKNPLRLMTINNLDSPVTKTADKTMKVTYTITRA